MGNKKKLLIVESPAKAKTIGKYLGGDFIVKSSVGHIRDLPKSDAAIKITKAGAGKWSFTPTYVVSEGKEKVVSELRKAAKEADEIYLASDPDREGEAIAWHLKAVLESAAKGKPFHRVSYNEITKNAVLKAVSEPGEINMPRVDAQQARRILDRLVGYKVSPLLWKNISCPNNKTLSAGRVQSVALRLLVERQREIEAFKPEKYYLMGVEAKKPSTGEKFVAKLSRYDGEKPSVTDLQSANNMLLDLADASLEVEGVKAQPKKRHTLPPFTTSTLQQAASSVLAFSPGKTMKTAQGLYERGLITYMRTDSVNVSAQARAAAKEYIVKEYGAEYYPEAPNFFKSKDGAQEAHEAIRPTNISAIPAETGLAAADLKLYDLIWRRFIASQMSDARTTVKTVSLKAVKAGLAHSYLFTASATDIDFEGFLKVMRLSGPSKRKNTEGEEAQDSDEVAALPALDAGERLVAQRWLADEKQTQGPAHYSEASLIKALEENGVGRPSTYAATIETLKTRNYAVAEKRKLIPLERGILVCDWLVKKMESLFNVGYTAKMEAELDKVEEDGEPMNDMLSQFYANFIQAIADANPPPDNSKFETVFALLDQVKTWKPAKKEGKKIYDDKAFVDSVKEQLRKGRVPVSARQLEFLIRMANAYSDQIPDVEAKLREAGLAAGVVIQPQRADEELVRYCFQVMDRIGGMQRNPFLKSLREQWERGRGLSLKQFAILARAVGENAAALDDCAEIRSKLVEFVPEGFGGDDTDPAVPGLIALMRTVTEWRPPAKRGKKLYDDKSFVESLADQYTRRHSLSDRQVMALRRVAVSYRDKIPEYDKHSAELGLDDIPSSREKNAQVLPPASEEE